MKARLKVIIFLVTFLTILIVFFICFKSPVSTSAQQYTCTTGTKSPYVTHSIPGGQIEAEDYDCGGELLSFHELDTFTNTNSYRYADPVDITQIDYTLSGSLQSGTGRGVYRISPGEWLEYTFQVTTPGTYNIKLRGGSSLYSGLYMNVMIDGTSAGILTIPKVPNAGMVDFSAPIPIHTLSTGNHVLRLTMGGYTSLDPANIIVDWVEIAPATVNTSTPTPSPSSDNSTPQSVVTPTPSVSSTIPPSSLVTEIKPEILSPLSGITLKGTQQVKVRAKEGANIDLQLQPKSTTTTGSLFLGRITINSGSTEGIFSWNTANTPNGDYDLYAIVSKVNESSVIVGPVKLKVYNLNSPTQTPKPSASGTLSIIPISTQSADIQSLDIVFPQEFNPKTIPVSKVMEISKIENTKIDDKMAIKFSGKSLPNTIITLLIFSNPIVVTVKTDANGLWTYNLEKPLEPGKHVVYTVVPQSDGSKIRSELVEFFISPAVAAGTNESLILASPPQDLSITRYLLITAGIIAIAVFSVIFIYWNKQRSLITNT